MKALRYIKDRLKNIQSPGQHTQSTNLSNFQPRVAPGLEIAAVTVGGRGGMIDIHYKAKAK
jgi:hypothetical protein